MAPRLQVRRGAAAAAWLHLVASWSLDSATRVAALTYTSSDGAHSFDIADCDAGPVGPPDGTVRATGGPQRFPMKIHFVWGFFMGVQGA